MVTIGLLWVVATVFVIRHCKQRAPENPHDARYVRSAWRIVTGVHVATVLAAGLWYIGWRSDLFYAWFHIPDLIDMSFYGLAAVSVVLHAVARAVAARRLALDVRRPEERRTAVTTASIALAAASLLVWTAAYLEATRLSG
jgi:hypothetical protein